MTSKTLTSRWTTIYTQTLPTLARSQPTWPVQLDHCFARIILDAVIGNSTSIRPDETPTPWTAKLRSPAVKNMSPQQLKACVELGEAIAEGRVDLVELDQRSLTVRGKIFKDGKRKREDLPDGAAAPDTKKPKTSARSRQGDIRAAMGAPRPTPPKSPSPAPIDPSLSSELTSHPTLTSFRKRVLLTLCQVPSGSYTTYLALSNHLSSSPRAVGNALRNNPFAPRVPCHRVVAADGGIGGFGGECMSIPEPILSIQDVSRSNADSGISIRGVTGKHNGEKVRLLRGEGVKVDAAGGRVNGSPWLGFK